MAFKDTWRNRVDGVDNADSSAVNELAEEVIRLGNESGVAGKDGGYYKPSIQQTDNAVVVSFTPSKTGMDSILPVTIDLPSGGNANVKIITYGDTINAEEIYNAYINGALIFLHGTHNFDYVEGGETTNETAEFLIPLVSITRDDFNGEYSLHFVGADNFGNGVTADYYLGWHLQIINNLTYAQEYADSIKSGGFDSLKITGTSISLSMASNTEYECENSITSLTIQGFETGTDEKTDTWCIKFKAGGSITVTIPDTVVWANGEPTFTAGKSYYLSFIPMFDNYLGVFAEV